MQYRILFEENTYELFEAEYMKPIYNSDGTTDIFFYAREDSQEVITGYVRHPKAVFRQKEIPPNWGKP